MNDTNRTRVALVTGGSSGIGKATVGELLGHGMVVYAAARRVEKMADIEAEGARPLRMDLTSEESISAGIDSITAQAGPVAVLVNNAGYGSYGAVEDVPIEEARRQFEVNLFGLARLTQLVLPGMRSIGHGRIINVSSMGGKIFTPLGAWYHATKHALEGFSDALRLETRPFGIKVAIIEPGVIASEWGAIAAESAETASGTGPYAEMARKAVARTRSAYDAGKPSPPEIVAKAISRAVLAREPRTRYVVGKNARTLLLLRGLLSDRGFERVVRTAYGL